jgi:acyl carrier protein
MPAIDKICAIVANVLELKPDAVQHDSDLVRDLGVNEDQWALIAMDIEDAFGIEVDDEDAERLRTPADIAELVQANPEAPQ